MKVAVVHSFYSESRPSGENSVVLDQVDCLVSAGHDVRLFARRTDELQHEAGYRMRSSLVTATGLGPSPVDALSAFRPDVIHVHNTFPNWGTSWLSDWGRRVVSTLHNFRSLCSNALLFRDGHPCTDCLRVPILPAVRHRCYRDSAVASLPLSIGGSPVGGLRRAAMKSARVIALNAAAAATFRDHLGRDVDVVPNFVFPDVQRPEPAGGGSWVYVGRLSDEKGPLQLVDNWPDTDPLDLIGDGPLVGQIETAIRGRANIRLLGKRPRAWLRENLRTYRGVVVPSMCPEGLPTVVLEALAAGRPLLLSKHLQVAAELVQEGAAVTFDPEASETLAYQLSPGGRNPSWNSMGSASLAIYKARFSPHAWLQAIEPIYDSVAAGARD